MFQENEIPSIEEREISHIVYQYATLITLLEGRKMNWQTLFIHTLSNKDAMKIAKEMLEETSEIEICKMFLLLEPSIVKSKMVATFAQNYRNAKQKQKSKSKPKPKRTTK